MKARQEKFRQLDEILRRIIETWYERVKENYVSEDDSKLFGITSELKSFHKSKNHRIKFSRKNELDVTYGLRAKHRDGQLWVESSVNNKSAGFDYDAFVEKLEAYYWRARLEKPWTHSGFDRFTHGDLLQFEPRMGRSVSLDVRREKADIIRLSFAIRIEHEDLLMSHKDVLQDLVENYCLAPLKRIYAESYREQ